VPYIPDITFDQDEVDVDTFDDISEWELESNFNSARIIGSSKHKSQFSNDGSKYSIPSLTSNHSEMASVRLMNMSKPEILQLSGLSNSSQANSSNNIHSTANTNSSNYDIEEGIIGNKKSLPILVAVDIISVRTLLSKVLNWWKYDVSHASNGTETLNHLKNNNFYLAIIDMKMPILKGLECVKLFRNWENLNRRGKKRQIVLCATDIYEGKNMIDKCIEYGADGLITKPISISMLKKIVRFYEEGSEIRKIAENFESKKRIFHLHQNKNSSKKVAASNNMCT